MSLRNRIHSYLIKWYEHDPEHFVHNGELERLASQAGFMASNSSRRCRELCEEGKIEARYIKSGSGVTQVTYRAKPTWLLTP